MRRTGLAVLLSLGGILLLWFTAVASPVAWTPAHELAPAGLTNYFAAGDLDGDGDDDVADVWNSNVCWNIGCPGPLAWQLEENVFPHIADCSEQSGTLGDCDGDGDLDLVYACFECCSFRVVWNIGTAQEPMFEYGGAIPGNPNAYANTRAWLADLDGDGDLDVVRPFVYRVDLYANTGTPEAGWWVYQGTIEGINLGGDAQLGIGDLDGDGDLDIVGVTWYSAVRCWENVGTPQAWSYVESPAILTGVTEPLDGASGLALLDVDCDGDLDLLMVGWDDAAYLYLNERFTSLSPASWGTIKALYR